ncbi:hypothetical protein DPMN_145592 [Dreissena polymorpha]|uniref:Uncharacterized protein n=1 Tax=Dreissena polymorpha TaxID=45954 RepID=A0A9D4F5F5_DREPO|nr:hypothetical protein DPMN_145592 [Dreissena polymorpha]
MTYSGGLGRGLESAHIDEDRDVEFAHEDLYWRMLACGLESAHKDLWWRMLTYNGNGTWRSRRMWPTIGSKRPIVEDFKYGSDNGMNYSKIYPNALFSPFKSINGYL